MKKRFLVFIAAAVFCLSLAACSDQGNLGGEAQGETEESEIAEGYVASADPTGTDCEVPAISEAEAENAGEEEVTVPEGEIFLIWRHSNMAWGYMDYGYFFDSDGNFYTFNLADKTSEIDVSLPFIEKLKIIREQSEPNKVMDKDLIKEFYALGEKLGADDEFTKKHAAYDAGQCTLYFYRAETDELLKCESEGDYDETPQNPYAREIVMLYEKFLDGYDEE